MLVPHLKRRLPVSAVCADSGIPISEYDDHGKSGLISLTFVPIDELQQPLKSVVQPYVVWQMNYSFKTNRIHVQTGRDVCT